MLVPPPDLNPRLLKRALAAQYDLGDAPLEFRPLGEDSWCYRCERWWISVRRDLRGHFPAAYEAAAQLRSSGLDFVLAPARGRDGGVVHHVAGYPVLVFPYVSAIPLADASPTPDETRCVMAMLDRVHASSVAAGLAAEDYTLSFEQDLDRAVDAAARRPGDAGPYTDALHRLLRHHLASIRAMRAEVAELAAACRASVPPTALTHGEPLASNILRTRSGLLVADWGDAMWGPPERDWCHVLRTLGTAPPSRPTVQRFYELKWVLSEIAEYATTFLQPHEGHADDAAMWQRLRRYLPEEC